MEITASQAEQLAAIDMGTNSFKLHLVRAHPTGRFLTLDRIKEPVLLGRRGVASDADAEAVITPDAQLRAISALRNFARVLRENSVSRFSVVATSAVREARNQSEFLDRIRDDVGFPVRVLSGEEEARLIYLGVLQFLPVFDKTALTVDIGGGSTEITLAKGGRVIFAHSLKLGHVTLTEKFVNSEDVESMRAMIRLVILESGLVEKVKVIAFDVAVGSSGTIKSIGKAVRAFTRYSALPVAGEFCGHQRFTREELGEIVEKLVGGGAAAALSMGMPKRRAEFMLAGAVLLWEIFELLGISEMEVSEYALGEGVVAEMMSQTSEVFDVNANARWRSVVCLARRFNSDKQMKSAAKCMDTAKDILVGIKNCNEETNQQSKSVVCFDEKDLECLEAAILLHNIGLFFGKKSYHKKSYQIIKNVDRLDGYKNEEIELIALLARFHRKKFPQEDQASLRGLANEIQDKFRILCLIMRISLALHRFQAVAFQGLEVLHPCIGYKLVLRCIKDESLLPSSSYQKLQLEDVEKGLNHELEHFQEVFHKKLSVEILAGD